MFEEKLHISLTKCFRGLCTDPTDAVIISGWYCIAQWVVNFDLRRPFTRELFEECLGNHSFRDWLRVCLLDHYAIDESAELLYQLCRIINRVNLTHSNAKMFYAHYLPCVIADMSFLHAFPTRIATMGHISCTLIHLAMTYAQERLGSSDIFSMPAQTVSVTYADTLRRLGISETDFEQCWEAVHFLDASSPMVERHKIAEVVKSYSQMKAPKSMLLHHYAQARHVSPAVLARYENPWAHVQKVFKTVGPEAGMSAEERLFNHGAYQISKEQPSDVIHTVFYKGRDDSKIECALVRSLVKFLLPLSKNTLIANPSPAFLVTFDEVLHTMYSDYEIDQRSLRFSFAVMDKTLSFLYKQQFLKYRFIPMSDLEKAKPEFDHVIILERDMKKSDILWNLLSLCTPDAFVTALVSQSAITNKEEKFTSALRENNIQVNWIMDVPAKLCESQPRKKILLFGKKSQSYRSSVVNLIFTETDANDQFLVPHKKRYCVPTELLYRNMTMAQMRKAAIKAAEGGGIPNPQKSEIYDFSQEIKIAYYIIRNNGCIEKARAYYRNIHRMETEVTRKKGKRPNDIKTERGLRGKSDEEILPKLERVAYYDGFYDDIVADIRDYYRKDLSVLSIKTMWFCCRRELKTRITYDEQIAMELFCGENQALSNLVSGKSETDEIVEAMKTIYGENGPGKKQWLQLYLIFQVGVESEYIEKNPLVPMMHVVQGAARKKMYMLNAALRKSHFTEDEEARMVAFLFEKIPVPEKKGQVAPRFVVESRWLAGAFSLFAGIPIREICPLCWGDLHKIEGCDEMQMFITKHLNSNGNVITNVDYGTKEHFRKNALDVILAEMLIQRRKYLQDTYGYTVESLCEYPIMLDIEYHGRGRHKPMMISRRTARKVNNQLLGVAQIPEELIVLLEGDAKFDINLNAQSTDLFAANFRHKAYHTCGFTAGELCHHVGTRAPDTFSRHYCDYGNDHMQYVMVRKLYRWTYIYDLKKRCNGSDVCGGVDCS